MKWTPRQKAAFAREGYVTLAGAVPPSRMLPALREINRLMGRGGGEESPACYGNQFWLDIKSKPAILDLFYETPLFGLSEALMGRGKIAPVTEGHIVLRFPQAPVDQERPVFHIDGIPEGPAGSRPEARKPGSLPFAGSVALPDYALQICVLLSDLPSEDWGNFAVAPGEHLRVQRFVRERGAEALRAGELPPVAARTRQIVSRAGSAVFSHYLLAHAGMGNTGPHIRYAVIFRLHHVDFAEREDKDRALRDIWLQWPGLGKMASEP